MKRPTNDWNWGPKQVRNKDECRYCGHLEWVRMMDHHTRVEFNVCDNCDRITGATDRNYIGARYDDVYCNVYGMSQNGTLHKPHQVCKSCTTRPIAIGRNSLCEECWAGVR